jgi:hypothetical protein
MAIGKITSKSLAADAVTSANLAPGAVTISDIPDSEITADKLHTTLDLSTKTLTLTQASVTAHESALTVTQSQISDLSTTSDLAEGTNLYYTDARARASISATGSLSYNSGTGVITYTQGNTDTVAEGSSNLYYTDARVDSRLAGGSVGNIVTTGYLAGPETFTIDPAAVGDNTGTVVIAGNLQVDGTTTTINSSTVEVDDINLTLASGAVNAAAANGAGITVDGASANITYNSTTDHWNMNKSLVVIDDNVGNLGGIIIKNVNTAAYSHGEVRIESENGAAYSTIFTDAQNNALRLGYNTSGSTLNIDSSGHVGIGTSDPQTKLEIYGEGSGDGTYSSAAITIGKTRGPKIVATQESGDNDIQGLAFFTKSSAAYADQPTERLRIDYEGKIGLGIQSPTTKLDIGNSGTFTFAQIRGQAGNYSGIKLARGAGDWSTNTNNNFGIVVTDNGLEIAKYTDLGNNNTGRSVFFQIDENGRVGVNNNQPSARFEVGNNFQVNAISAPSTDRNDPNIIATFQKDANAFIRVASPNNTGNAGIEFYGAGDRGSIYGTSAYDIKLETNSAYGQADIILTTSPTQDNMRVGVGINSPSEKLHVAGNVLAEDYKFSAISKDITAGGQNDAFVYDTRNDSDGGQWRKRVRDTSWYNEASSSTRSSRADFPVVAILSVTGDGLFIYDADDPECPLWMSFTKNGSVGSSGNIIQNQNNQNPRAVEALNGVICVGGSFLVKIDFIADRARLHADASGMWEYRGNIEQRNDQNSFWNEGNDTSKFINNDTVHDVSMIVTDESPIDPITKLPIPLIGIANELAVCIIHPSEEVTKRVDTYTPSMRTRKFSWTGRGTEYAYNHSWGGGLPGHDSRYVVVESGHTYDTTGLNYGRSYQTWERFYDDTNWNNSLMQYLGKKGDSNAGLIDISTDTNGTALATKYGATKFHKDGNAVAFITKDYNTGWMHKRIKFAVACDATGTTDNAPLTFSDDFGNSNNWTHAAGSNISGGTLNITNTAASRATNANWGGVSGEDYVLVFRVTANQNSGVVRLDDDGPGAIGVTETIYGSINPGFVGFYCVRFTRTASPRIRFLRTAGGQITIDGMWISRVDDRYQRHENHAGIVGTVPRAPVATGSELMGYNCQSSNNFMVVPYQSSLAGFGSIWYFSTWVNRTTTNTWDAIFSMNASSATHGDGIFWYSGNALRVQGRTGGGHTFSTHSLDNYLGWQKIDIVSNGKDVLVYRNGRFNQSNNYAPSLDLPNSDWYYALGAEPTTNGYIAVNGRGKKMALTKLGYGSDGLPSAELIHYMYENERHMFKENTACTLYGTSDSFSEISYDDGTQLLHLGSSSGRSSFRGLTRVENSTTNIGGVLSARNGLIVED